MKQLFSSVARRVRAARRHAAVCLFAAAVTVPAAGVLAGNLTFSGPPNDSEYALYEDYYLVHSWTQGSIYEIPQGTCIRSTSDGGTTWGLYWGPRQNSYFEWTVQHEMTGTFQWECNASYYNSQTSVMASDIDYSGIYHTP